MAMDLRTTLPAGAITLGCLVVVTAGVALAPAPTLARSATASERAELAEAIAASEREWNDETAKNFPADSWSQRDDFHGREFMKAQELAKDKGVRIEDVLRAVDDDIHHAARLGGDDRNAAAVPCKPRPFYD